MSLFENLIDDLGKSKYIWAFEIMYSRKQILKVTISNSQMISLQGLPTFVRFTKPCNMCAAKNATHTHYSPPPPPPTVHLKYFSHRFQAEAESKTKPITNIRQRKYPYLLVWSTSWIYAHCYLISTGRLSKYTFLINFCPTLLSLFHM